MKIDLEKLHRHVGEGLVSETKHPTLDLFIYNYTPTCVYAHAWNEITLLCRGLILDENGGLVERPFPKFFNLEEHSRSDLIFREPFLVFEKVDGSLGILYRDGEGLSVATRGSFASKQAVWATEWLRGADWWFEYAEGYPGKWVPDPEYTYLFEIIYRNNRIVVDYGEFEGLVFLAAVHKETGASIFNFGDERDFPGIHVNMIDSENLSPRDLKTLETDNAEGFVVFFPNSNRRMKTKFDEYVRVHRIVTGTNTKRIWEWLESGQDISDLLEHVPDEFYDFVRRTVADMEGRYAEILNKAQAHYLACEEKVGPNAKQKDFAWEALKYRDNDLIFRLKAGKPVTKAIWKRIKPAQAEWYSNYDLAEET